jgi:hypothetical protein
MYANEIVAPLKHPRLGKIAIIESPIQVEQHSTEAEH